MRITLYLFCWCSLFLLTGCNEGPVSAVSDSKIITLSGTIKNAPGQLLRLRNGFEVHETIVDGDQFKIAFERDAPSFYGLELENLSIFVFLSPGNHTILEADRNDFQNGTVFKGDGAAENNYFTTKNRLQRENQLPPPELYGLNEKDFLDRLSSYEAMRRELLADLPKKSIDASFFEIEEVNIEYENYNQLLHYEDAHRYFTQNPGFRASRQFGDLIRGIDISNSDYLSSHAFSNFILGLIAKESQRLLNTNPAYIEMGASGELQSQLDAIKVIVRDEVVKNTIAGQIIVYFAEFGAASEIAEIVERNTEFTLPEPAQARLDKIGSKWARLAKGQPAPNFKGRSPDGKEINLTDLKGSHVYIDVWATWCGPCLAEQPALSALENRFANDDSITFLGVSIDENQDAWRAMIKRKDLTGVQIFTENAWQSTICQDYLIQGIPRFILIDKEGKIVDVDAPRPSSTEITKLLEGLSDKT